MVEEYKEKPHPGSENFTPTFEVEDGEDKSSEHMAAFVRDLKELGYRYDKR